LKFNRQYLDVFSSEASRCENVIYPILREVYKRYAANYSLWSHKSLLCDEVLSGIPDYLITSRSELGKNILGQPIVVVVEAKQNNFTEGWGQCLAELVAAQLLNQATFPVYGIVTDGEVWHFGKLVEQTFIKNENVFAINELSKIFGAISFMIAQAQLSLSDSL
jgi:hypothetical protein